MSTFRVPVVRIRAIEPIPNADAIELAVVGDYRSVVRKGKFATNSLAAYLPEGAVLPEWLLRHLGLWDDDKFTGKLAGAKGDRIKAIRLRGALSQGILLAPSSSGMFPRQSEAVIDQIAAAEGDDLAEFLGVTKYEPPIPAHMAGEMASLFGHTVKYDIENRKAYPDVLREGEMVAFTEKIHGSFCVIGVVPGLGHSEIFLGGDVYVSSKGQSAKGLVFKDVEANSDNIYVQVLRSLEPQVRAVMAAIADPASPVHGVPVHVMGEVYGPGVQDLGYGLKERRFRAFEVYVGAAGRGRFMSVAEKREFLASIGIDTVEFLYVGPFSIDVLRQHVDGETVTGNGAHIREGVVITPMEERRDPSLGRVILKEVSAAYLTRKNKDATEYN